MQVVGIITIRGYSRFRQFKERRVPSGDLTGEVRVTVPVGSATLKIPESASRIERINNWVAAVLSAEGGIAGVELAERGAYLRYGTRRVSS